MSKVYLKPLDDILTHNEEQRAFLYGVAAYLKRLNKYAASKKTPNLIEYNVGGVISIVEQVETLANTFRSIEDEAADIQIEDQDDCFELLVHSWFCYESSKNQMTSTKLDAFFSSKYDKSGKLPLRIGQFLLSLEPAINTYKYEMFKVSHNLLARYSDHIRKGDSSASPGGSEYQNEGQESIEEGVSDVKGLLASFKTLYQLAKASKVDGYVKAYELRKQGNDLFKRKRIGAAIAKYTEAIILDPKNEVLFSNRGAAYTSLGDAENAINDFKKAVELKPEYETAWTRLAFSYLTIGDSIKSVEAYSKAIKLASDKKMIPQYIQKLCSSLHLAEGRARANGITDGLLQYTGPIQDIRNQYTSMSHPQTERSVTGRPIALNNGTGAPLQDHLVNLFQQFRGEGDNGERNRNGAPNNDPLVTTLNGVGAFLSGTGSFQMFGDPNNAQSSAQGNNQNNNQNQVPNTTQGTNENDTQPPQQSSNQATPIPPVSGVSTSTGDPESMIPEVNDNIPQPQGQQQQQRPQSLADIIQNSLPEGLRNTIGPALRFAMNNANGQFGTPSPGVNGEVIFTSITTGPNGEVISNNTNAQPNQGTPQNENTNRNDQMEPEDFDLD